MGYFGSIDLTALGQIARQHPQLVRDVTFQDGTVHKFLSIDVSERKQPSDKGHTHYIKVTCKKEAQVQGLKYYVADLKPSKFGSESQQQPVVQAAPAPSGAVPQGEDENDLPF